MSTITVETLAKKSGLTTKDLLKKIDDLDKLSMQLKRRITVPLIKEIIEK